MKSNVIKHTLCCKSAELVELTPDVSSEWWEFCPGWALVAPIFNDEQLGLFIISCPVLGVLPTINQKKFYIYIYTNTSQLEIHLKFTLLEIYTDMICQKELIS